MWIGTVLYWKLALLSFQVSFHHAHKTFYFMIYNNYFSHSEIRVLLPRAGPCNHQWIDEKRFLYVYIAIYIYIYLSRPAERILNALPRWIAIARFWRNQLASLGSPVASIRRRPIALMITPVDSPYTPIVSTAIGSNWCASARAAYLQRLRSSALFAAMPASIADLYHLFRCTPAKVSTHVQSHTKLLPPLKGKTVIPSGRDPSPLSNPGGFKTDGRPAFWGALLTTSPECITWQVQPPGIT